MVQSKFQTQQVLVVWKKINSLMMLPLYMRSKV